MKQLLITGVSAIAGAAYLLFEDITPPVAEGLAYQKLPRVPYSDHPNRHFITRAPESIGIIGGGSAGLTTAKVLREQGYNVQVFEKGPRIGGVWADNYEDAGLQGPYPHFHMPDHEFPPGTERLPKLAQVRDFLDAYVEKFNLKPIVALNTEVKSVSQSADGEWTLTLQDGSTRRFDFLVLGTGMFFKPHIPSVEGLTSFQGKVLHCFDFRNATELCAGKRVVVVGGGKSAYDAINLASERGGTVTSIMRKVVWTVPLDLKVFGMQMTSLLKCRLLEFIDPPPDEPKTRLHDWLAPFADLYWWVLTRELKRGLPECMIPKHSMRDQRRNILYLRDPVVLDKIAKGEITVVTGEIEKAVPEGLVVNGQTIPADVIIFATGFSQTSLGLWEGDLWAYRGMILPKVKNFAAIGYKIFVCTSLKNSLQAAWLAEVLRGNVELPSIEDMEANIAHVKETYLKAYSEYRSTAAYSWPELKYYDLLLKDMHLRVCRKPTRFLHLLDMVDPLDYKTVLTHRI